MTIPEIICKYRIERNLSQEQFVERLTEKLQTSLTKQIVSLWETGLRKPGYFLLLSMTLKYGYGDWRRNMALECLAVLKPELYAPDKVTQNG